MSSFTAGTQVVFGKKDLLKKSTTLIRFLSCESNLGVKVLLMR